MPIPVSLTLIHHRYNNILKLISYVQPILWCTAHRPSPPPPISEQADDTARAAVKSTTDIWKKAQLTVAFQEKQLLEKWGINETTILKWANRWKPEQDSPAPVFVHHGDKFVEEPDIIVELNGINNDEFTICMVWPK